MKGINLKRIKTSGLADNGDDRELITIQQFARRLSISVWTARAWAYSGRIASCKCGSRLQVPTSEVTRIIEENLRPRVAPSG